MLGAGIVLREHLLPAADNVDNDRSARHTHYCFDAVGQARFYRVLYNKSVNDYLDVVLFVLIYLYLFGKVIGYAVDSGSYKARFHTSFQFLCMLALSASYKGCEHLYLCTLFKRHHLINYLIDSLVLYLPAADRTVRNAYTRIQKTQIVVYLGDCTDC